MVAKPTYVAEIKNASLLFVIDELHTTPRVRFRWAFDKDTLSF
jgi:hypothetical protein